MTLLDVDVCRDGFLSRFLPSGPAKVGFYTGAAARSQLVDATRGRRCLTLIHGYNSPREGVRRAYAEIITGMQVHGILPEYDVILQVFWPGGSKIGYHLAEMKAEGFLFNGAGDHLREAMELCAWSSMDFLMHSAGNRVGCDANRKGQLRIRNFLMCAAAIDDDSVCYPGGEFREAIASLEGRALAFHSRGDGVLGKAYRLAKFDRALGLTGPQKGLEYPSQLKPVDANGWVHDHSDFRKRAEFYEAWRALLREGAGVV